MELDMNSVIVKIRTILWKAGIWTRCPLCSGKVEETGFVKDEFWQNYRCANEYCDFGNEHHNFGNEHNNFGNEHHNFGNNIR